MLFGLAESESEALFRQAETKLQSHLLILVLRLSDTIFIVSAQ